MPNIRKKSKKKDDTTAADTTTPLLASPKPPPPPSVVVEKRQFRYRSSCPSKLAERLLRANTQRMYLIQQQQTMNHNIVGVSLDDIICELSILGSTGNVYIVKLQSIPCCTCPDFIKNKDLCKHIIFVLLKVIGISSNNPLAYQKSYIQSELKELMQLLNSRRVGGTSTSNSVMANEEVQRNYARLQQQQAGGSRIKTNDDDIIVGSSSTVQRRSLDDTDDCDCPVCFDKMNINDTKNILTYCQAACGTNFHLQCIQKWFQNASNKNMLSCPNCRQEWIGIENTSNKKDKNSLIKRDDEYVNLGTYQGGVPTTRDTSTYHSYKRRRYYR